MDNEVKMSGCVSCEDNPQQLTRQGGRVPATCPPGFQGRYTVRSGDTMFFIARRFGVSLNALIAANPHIPNPALIFPGDVLCVPGVPPVDGRVPVTCPPGFQGRYTVRPGDTMFFIAQRFGVSLNALIAANPHIPNPNLIFPGDVLCVPGVAPVCRVPATCPPGFTGRYTVQPGDTMFLIAISFGVSLSALIAANPHIPNPNVIFPCDVLCVPPDPPVRKPKKCPPGFPDRYTVRPGDTMFFIAQRFGVSLSALIAANPHIPNPNIIFPGDVLCVPRKKPKKPYAVLEQQDLAQGTEVAGQATVVEKEDTPQLSIVVSHTPQLNELGEYDQLEGVVAMPPDTEYRFPLEEVTSEPALYKGSIDLDAEILAGELSIEVRPVNRETGEKGPILLQGAFADNEGEEQE